MADDGNMCRAVKLLSEEKTNHGQIWFYDTAFLPPSKFNAFTAIGVYTEYISGYTCAFCMKNVDFMECIETAHAVILKKIK